ncbi:MAG: hypothetical protein KME49_25345 [Brasilonema octagenarum HA4186-MV1]|jgi:hypothetical protein|nr:hypothetical protein [Brasilonema octagenarum HA4186-MV1]
MMKKIEQSKPSRYNLTIQRLKIEGKERPNRNDYIQAFGLLPDFVLKANGILSASLEEGNLGVLLRSHRDAFKAIKKWIVHFVCNANDSLTTDPPENGESWEFDYKPHAEESWALLNLCEEIFQRDQFGWKDSIASLLAAEIWFSCEFERLENTLKSTGILGTTPQRGKHQSCDTMSKQISSDFNSIPSRRFADASAFEPNEIQTWDSTEEAIRIHAEKIAQLDTEFCHIIYSNYIKIRKRTIRSIRNNPNLQVATLEKSGDLFVGGKGKRGKSQKRSKSKKGFCKEK